MSDTKISALTALAGTDVAPATDVLPIVDTSVTTTKKITVDALLAGLFGSATAPRLKVGSFTRDLATASGTQAVTGVGFSPKALVFVGGIATLTCASIGVDDGTLAFGIGDDAADIATAWAVGSASIQLYRTAGGNQTATISSLDSDGFTLTWVKTGSPTGTATIGYLAFR